MLTDISPKLPMRVKSITLDFYVNKLGFSEFGVSDYPYYLMVSRDSVQLHFFQFEGLDPAENYGQVYLRTDNIEALYNEILTKGVEIKEAGRLQIKPWAQKEFSLLDPDANLLTFGQSML